MIDANKVIWTGLLIDLKNLDFYNIITKLINKCYHRNVKKKVLSVFTYYYFTNCNFNLNHNESKHVIKKGVCVLYQDLYRISSLARSWYKMTTE